MVKLTNVSKIYGSKTVLQPMSLEFARGKTTVLLGPSGCGKTTLLRMIVGLISPTSGQVEIDGTTITHENLRLLRQKIGYVVQDGGLFPHLTNRENIVLMAKHLEWPTEKIKSRFEELGALTQLSNEILDRRPARISGGQRQRVSLMRALMLNPELVILDEPLGALDTMIRSDLQKEMKKIFSAMKKTVILVTHDLAEAASFGHEIMLMRDGRILQKSDFHELATHPRDEFVKEFVGAYRDTLVFMKEILQ